MVLLACSNSSAGPAATGSPSATANVGGTPAADLRVQLDLLLGEQVMIVAKESAAAVDHSDQYAAYTALLTTNSIDLADVLRRAYGNTAAAQFTHAWTIQNGYFVDYAIGVVTHNDAKANGAMSGLTNGYVPQFSQLISGMSKLPLDSVTQLTTQQVLEDKALIDDIFAQKHASFYADLHRAYAQTARLGDALAEQIAQGFPDKFPGDPAAHAVDVRVSFNVLLQEHSYLATLATDATVAGRTQESTAASSALGANAEMLRSLFASVMGNDAGVRFIESWTVKDNALFGYAAGTAGAKSVLTDTFVTRFASVVRVGKPQIAHQIDATLKVIDDQRAKSSKSVAGDDRAAATAMQPIADSI